MKLGRKSKHSLVNIRNRTAHKRTKQNTNNWVKINRIRLSWTVIYFLVSTNLNFFSSSSRLGMKNMRLAKIPKKLAKLQQCKVKTIKLNLPSVTLLWSKQNQMQSKDHNEFAPRFKTFPEVMEICDKLSK